MQIAREPGERCCEDAMRRPLAPIRVCPVATSGNNLNDGMDWWRGTK
jgi:hypothetical protein